jgi:hypothetical protein
VEDIDAYAITGGRAFQGNKGTGVTTSDQTLALALQFGVTTQLEMSAAADTVADAHSSGIAVTAPRPGLGDSRRRGSVVTCAIVLVDSGPRGRTYDAQGEDLMIYHQTRYTIRPDAPKDQVDHALEMLHRMG